VNALEDALLPAHDQLRVRRYTPLSVRRGR
jgi:hypothetical protein